MTRRPRIQILAAVIALTLAVLGAAWWLMAPRWAERSLERAQRRLAERLTTSPESSRATDPTGTAPASDRAADTGAERAPAEAEVEPEAARWLSDGCRTLTVAAAESDRLADLTLRPPDDWTLSERDLVTALARREAEPLAMIERAGAAGATPSRPDEPPGPSAGEGLPERRETGARAEGDEMVELAEPLLRGTRLLLARAGLALETAPEEAGRSLVALAGSARALQADPRPAALELGTTIEVLFLRGVHWAVASPAVPREVIADLRAALPEPGSERRIHTVVARRTETAESDDPTGWRRLVPGGSTLEAARRLDALDRILAASREPGLLAEVATAGSPVSDALAGPGGVDALLRMQAADASAELARAALDLRLRVGPRASPTGPDEVARRLERVPPDPFAGGRPEAQEGPGGRLVLVNPAAAEAWSGRWGTPPGGPAPPPFAWRLPPRRR